MREIKFRGRSSKDNKTWFTGSLVSLTDIDEAYIDHYDGLRRVIERYPVDPDTVGQFTGLLDSAGKEIYEGDIISIQGAFGATATIVKWLEGMWCVKKDLPLNHVTGIATVVGNVHDNPQLQEDSR